MRRLTAIPVLTHLARPRSWASEHPALVLATASVLLYASSLGFALLNFDDDIHLLRNPYLATGDWSGLTGAWTRSYAFSYTPLVYTVWFLWAWLTSAALNVEFQYLPMAFHALNVIFHALNVILVWRLLCRLLPVAPGRLPGLSATRGRKPSAAAPPETGVASAPMAPLVGALFYMLHPVLVEPVAWISGFRDLFSTFLSLVSLEFFVRSQPQSDAGSLRTRLSVLSFLLFVLACLAKPGAVVLLPVIVLLAFWEAREAQPPLRAAVSAAARAVPWLAVAVLTAYLTKEVQPEAGVDFPTPWGLRPLVALDAIGFYLRQIVLPWALVPDYGRTPPYVLNGPFPLLHVVLAAAFIGFGCLAFSKRARPLRPFARWSVLFVVCILPVSGLKPFHFQNISTVADRYLCFPMLWAALAFAHLWQILSGRGPRLVLGAALVAFGLRTLWQTPLWRDDKALFHGIIAANHRSWTGHQTLSVIAFREGDFLASLNHGWTSLELNYRQTTLRVQIAACLANLGRTDEAIQFVRDSLRLIPLYPLLHIELADLLAAQGNHAAAEAELRDTIAMVPQDPEPKLALARLYLAVHRQDEARVLIEQALRDDPGSVEARRLLQGEDQDRGGP